MIRLSVMYPNREGAKFDPAYYFNRHLPLVNEHWQGLVQGMHVMEGLSGAGPDEPPTYRIMAHVEFASMDDLNAAMGMAQPLIEDFPNFTDIQPVIQISKDVS